MSDCLDSLDFTIFNEKTLINSTNNPSNYAYVDKTAASSLDVNYGDIVSITIAGSKIDFTVSRVYEANNLFTEGIVLVNFSGTVKEVYETNASPNSYSGAFIKASNDSECSNYLRNYIPMGRLKDRSEFDSDEAYNTYNNAILSGSYLNEITNFYELRAFAEKEVASAKTIRTVMSLIGVAVAGIVYLIISEVLRKRKSEEKYFAEVLKNKKNIKNYRIYSAITSVIIYLMATISILSVLDAADLILFPSLISFTIIILTLVINMAQDKKYLKVGKNKNAK